MLRAHEHLLSAGLVIVLTLPIHAQVKPQAAAHEYLPLDAPGLARTVGEALQICSSFFQNHGTTITFDGDGKLVIGKSPDGDSYRAARDSGSVLTRANAYRVLTAATAHLAQLLDLTSSSDVVTRRGAAWLLCRPPEPDEPVIPMVVELLDDLRFDPDPLIRATLASLPHRGVVGARDPDPLVRASWWKGFRAAQFEFAGQPLTELETTFLRRALTDQHAFVRMCARLAHERLVEDIPASQAGAIAEVVAGLATDPSPWARPEVASWHGDDRTIGWLNSLSAWIPVPWLLPRTPMGYRDGAVGNPALLIARLEFLRSARDVTHLPLDTLRDSPEPELRSTAASMRFPLNRASDVTAPSRLKLIEDPYPDVRLAAVITFDAGAGFPYPTSLVPGVQEYILGGIASTSRWEHHAAIVLARGIRSTHHGIDATQWAHEQLLPAGEDEARRPTILRVLAALLPPESAERILERLDGEGWPVKPTLRARVSDDPAELLVIARSVDPRAARAVADLIAGGPDATLLVVEAMSSTDPRDGGLRSAASQQFAGLSLDELRPLLAPALAAEASVAAVANGLLKR